MRPSLQAVQIGEAARGQRVDTSGLTEDERIAALRYCRASCNEAWARLWMRELQRRYDQGMRELVAQLYEARHEMAASSGALLDAEGRGLKVFIDD